MFFTIKNKGVFYARKWRILNHRKLFDLQKTNHIKQVQYINFTNKNQ